jgi:hypothetical protein
MKRFSFTDFKVVTPAIDRTPPAVKLATAEKHIA